MKTSLALANDDIGVWQRSLSSGNFAWPEFVQWIGKRYSSQVGMAIQIFDEQRSVEFLYANFEEFIVDLYVKYNYVNPWQDIFRNKRTGDLIVGKNDSDIADFMDKYGDFANSVMIPHNVNYGVGAVLLKDNDINPNYAVTFVALRSIKDGEYRTEEIREFKSLIGPMVYAANRHPEILNFKKIYQETRYKFDAEDVKYKGKMLLYRNMFLNDYKSRLIKNGFSEEDAAKAAEILREIYIERGWPISPDSPAKQDEGIAPQAPTPMPETWEEAKAQVPGLMKWTDAKAGADKEGREFSIVDHLRDLTRGYGVWTLSVGGLPRNILYRTDKDAYIELNQWQQRKNKKTREINQLPQDMRLPTRSEVIDKKVKNISHAEIQEARRVLRAKDRRNL